ncbi:hypothetical protein MNBD_GAMMA09-39 [hydrothermal vent metagenome]|uniref:PIN domain-containing protein n=1 Tax=hydrothermal vent metagenome TaxID=652676 RepID=A0A3B0XRT8_9ZZZZ
MLLVVDANVLIDYFNSDLSVLTLAVNHIGPIYVPGVVLDEVDQLSEGDCERLGLIVLEEPVEILLAAGEKRGALSFEDHVCLLLAKENGWICVSNDKPLHRACGEEKVTVKWGLKLMIELVEKELLEKETALNVAQIIQTSNPKHITAEIIEEFRIKINL